MRNAERQDAGFALVFRISINKEFPSEGSLWPECSFPGISLAMGLTADDRFAAHANPAADDRLATYNGPTGFDPFATYNSSAADNQFAIPDRVPCLKTGGCENARAADQIHRLEPLTGSAVRIR